MNVIRDTNVSADLDSKLGKNVWWKPEIDKKILIKNEIIFEEIEI